MIRLLLILLCLASPVAAESLSGIVRWEGEKTIKEMLRVESGAELTIASGSVIHLQRGGLEISGRLIVSGVTFEGSGGNGIILKNSDASVIEKSTLRGFRTALEVFGGAPQLHQLKLEENEVGIELRQKSAAAISDCRFNNNHKVGLFVKDESTPQVTGNTFSGTGRFGAYLYRATPRLFSGNRFEKNATGLAISHYGSDGEIISNHFYGNEVGILVDRAARPTLRENTLSQNTIGLRLEKRADAEIHGNRLSRNETAIFVAFSSYPQIHGNDLAENGMALKLEHQSSTWERERGSSMRQQKSRSGGVFAGRQGGSEVTESMRAPQEMDGTVDARNNWWGDVGQKELKGLPGEGNPTFIFDGRDVATFSEGGKDYPLDTVRFSPWLSTNPLADKDL